jgi:hypothetical protein
MPETVTTQPQPGHPPQLLTARCTNAIRGNTPDHRIVDGCRAAGRNRSASLGARDETNIRYRSLIGHSGKAARRQEPARRAQGIDLLVNCNFSAKAICNAVMDNDNVIERTAVELIKLYRQLGCRPACGSGAGWVAGGDDGAAGDKWHRDELVQRTAVHVRIPEHIACEVRPRKSSSAKSCY